MAAGSLPVVLKKFRRYFSDIPRILSAKISSELRCIGILDNSESLILCDTLSEERVCLSHVKEFQWIEPSSTASQSYEKKSSNLSFVVVTSDFSVELHSVICDRDICLQSSSPSASNVHTNCIAALTVDLLKALLSDRGKECEVQDLKLISCSEQDGLFACSVTLLVNQEVVTSLKLTQDGAHEVVHWFALGNLASSLPLFVSDASFSQVQKCKDLIFSMFAAGPLIIHHIDGTFIGYVNIQDFFTSDEESLDETELVAYRFRPNVCCFEVVDDLSVLTLCDTRNTLYIVNLDDYFASFPDHFCYPPDKSSSSSRRTSMFQYDAVDEDVLLRDPRTARMSYGDRVWKTELAQVIHSVKQQCSHQGAGVSRGVGAVTNQSRCHWFDALRGTHQLQFCKSTQYEKTSSLESSCALTGFHSKQQKQNRKTSASTLDPEESVPVFNSISRTIPAPSWTKGYKVHELFATGESVMLWLKVSNEEKDSESGCEMGIPEFAYGMLCLYSFSSGELSAHGFTEPTMVVRSTGTTHPQYILNARVLAIPAFGVTQDQLVHKVIMYENAAMADSLCHINHWDHCTIPIHALEVALKLRQLDTVAFFLKNQENVFSTAALCQSTQLVLSSSPSFSSSLSAVSPSSFISPPAGLDTNQIEAVINLLVKAVKYNARQEHNRHFTSQLLQMTLSYLHGLMEDGASVLEKRRVECNAVRPKTQNLSDVSFEKPIVASEDIEKSMRFITTSIIELRKCLANVPSGAEGGVSNEMVVHSESDLNVVVPDHEQGKLFEYWRQKHDLDVIKDAMVRGNIPLAQLFFQQERKFREKNLLGTCDGALSSITSVGLKLMLNALVQQDMDTFVTMATNMGRDVIAQLRSICFYTLHRPLRDYLIRELEERCSLSEEEKGMAHFVHTLEKIYNLQSFDKAKQCLSRASESEWNDLGLLKNSFNLSSNQVLKEFLHTGSLLLGQSYKEISQGGATGYVEVLLEWVRTWDVSARERILLEALLNGTVPSHLSSEVEISAQSLWQYLLSRNDWPKAISWIRATARNAEVPCISPVIHIGQQFAVRDGDLIMPPLTPDVYSQFTGCTKVLKEILLDELTKYGMFTTFQLSDFPLILRHLCRTQTLFGETHPFETLNIQLPDDEIEPDSDLVGEKRDNARKSIVSVADFHVSFIEYCVTHKLVNLLYHYMDFYRLGETMSSVRDLGLEDGKPIWVNMLVKFRLAGLHSEEPSKVCEASLSNAGIVLQLKHPSVTAMLEAGRVIMALTSLMYSPLSLSQAIVPAGRPLEDPIWQVSEPLLREALEGHHKLYSALFPLTTSVHGMERQDITVYQLLQGNSPFEISRMFNWQATNELAGKSGNMSEMPHFSCPSLVTQFGHEEKLTFAYYLRHGRPSFAFSTFVSEHVNTRVIPKSRILAAAKKAYRVALQNFSNARITCGCVAFTEMIGVDSTCLRVDIQSANRILTHGGWETLVEKDSGNESVPREAIEYEFLTTRDRALRPTSLLKALEESTRNLINKECLDRTSLEARYHWSLVLMFCRAHKLDLSAAYLVDCARANKWLPFICHAQTEQFPKHQVLEIVEHHFTNSHLREHLHLALKNTQTVQVENQVDDSEKRRRKKKTSKRTEQVVTPTRDVRAQFISRVLRQPASSSELASSYGTPIPSTQSSSAEDEETSRLRSKRGSDKDSSSAAEGKSMESSERVSAAAETSREDNQEKPLDPNDLPDDLCDVLFACQAAKVPWRSFLVHALALRRPLLAVIAACYEESKPLDCLCAWLYSTFRPEVLDAPTQLITGISNNTGNALESLQWRRWKLDDLTAIIEEAVAYREVYAHTLVKAFYIFNPDSPMLPFLRFFESFVVHYDFSSCREQLSEFKKGYNKARTDKKQNSATINDTVWLERVTGQVTKVMLTESMTSYEQSRLLQLLSKATFGRNFFCQVPNYFKLNRIAEILRDTETEMSFQYMLEEDSPEAKQEGSRVLDSLLHHKRFGEARKLAGVLELPEDDITLKEVLHDYEVIQNSLLWELQQGRLAFWFKADECFRNNVCNPDVAGAFFEERANEEQLSFKERAKLLSMALKWFSNKAERKSGRRVKSHSELKQMERKIWFYKIRAEIEKDREAILSRSVSHVEFLPDHSELAQDIATASSSSVHSSVTSYSRADMAKELVQPEAIDAEQDEDAVLETEEEMKALEGVIDELLEHFHVTQARKLATLFGHSSQELDIVLSCIFLAQGTGTVEGLSESVEKLLSRPAQKKYDISESAPSIKGRKGSFMLGSSLDSSLGSESDTTEVDWVLVEDILATMESLAFHSVKGKKCCSRTIICYKISQSLGVRYQAVVEDDPFNVLRSLLVSVLDTRFKLADAYIKAFSLDTERVTGFLAEIILHSLRVYTGEVSLGENFELIFNAAPSCDDISNVIRLCSDHSLLGTRLLENATTLLNVRANSVPPQAVYQLEVELLVRAHDCHTLACNMEGISSVLKHGKLLTSSLADARHYSLMVRLLTGVGRFHEMSYVFETLLMHHHFELLCRRGIDKENKLKVALLDYLKRYHPDDTEKYTMVAYHFSMYREIAESLESSAITQLKTLKDFVIAATPELEAKLNSIMKSFCYACDNYSKDGCQRHSQQCLKQARLIQLQIQLLPSGTRVINLDDHELQRFAAKHGYFFEALLVTDAYGKRGYSIWVDAVYTHVVLGGDFKYFHDFKSVISLSSVLFVDVVNKYKNEGTRSSQITVNLKKLLNYVTEARIRYRLATDLNFRDVASSILEGDGGSYLRDIMAP